jgi:hypothetical protein
VEDLFASHLTPVFIESRPLDDLWLQGIIGLGYQFPCERLDNRCGVDAMREEVVK